MRESERNDRPGSSHFRGWLITGVFALSVVALACGAANANDRNELASGEATEQPESTPAPQVQPVAGPNVQPQADTQVDTLFKAPIASAEGSMGRVVGGLIVTSTGITDVLTLAVWAEGLTPGDHAWHIHTGACGASGDVVIPISATATDEGLTGPLHADDDGLAAAWVEIGLLNRNMLGMLQRSLHIHERAGADHGTSVACGSI
jgi:Cu/Zn superoxide dismutase